MSTSGSGTLNPLSPIVNQGNLYVTGMQLTYLTNSTFSVGVGQCRDSTDTVDLIMGAKLYQASGAGNTNNSTTSSVAVTVTRTATGAGGLDTGTLAASTLYYVYAIGDSRSFNATSVVFSLSATTPNLPAGYDCFRRVGCVSTNGSSQIRKFVQTGSGTNRKTWYDAGVAPGSAATAGSTTFVTIGTLTTLVPAIACEAILTVSLTPNTAGNTLRVQPFGGTNGYAQISSNVTTKAQFAQLSCPMGLNAGVPEIDYATSEASDVVAFLVAGYADQL